MLNLLLLLLLLLGEGLLLEAKLLLTVGKMIRVS